MSGTTMVVVIVFISVGFSAIASMYYKHLAFKEKMLKHQNSKNAEDAKLSQELAALKERVVILEKIVTDEGYSVQKEINNI